MGIFPCKLQILRSNCQKGRLVKFVQHIFCTVGRSFEVDKVPTNNSTMPVIFQRGLKYSLRHYYTVVGVATLFGVASAAVAYRSIKQARSGPSLQKHHT